MSRTLAELSDGVAAVSDRYARIFDIRRDNDWYLLKLQEELGELTAEALRASGRGRRRTVRRPRYARSSLTRPPTCWEACCCYGIDLEAALQRKWLVYLEDAAGERPA